MPFKTYLKQKSYILQNLSKDTLMKVKKVVNSKGQILFLKRSNKKLLNVHWCINNSYFVIKIYIVAKSLSKEIHTL